MNIEDMTIEQLKAIAYDAIVQVTRLNQNLAIIQAELEKRDASSKQSPVREDVPVVQGKKDNKGATG